MRHVLTLAFAVLFASGGLLVDVDVSPGREHFLHDLFLILLFTYFHERAFRSWPASRGASRREGRRG